jgi:hypothetical protein
MRTLALFSLVLLASCASLPPSITGGLSDEDIRQIRSLIEHRIAFKRPIRTIARERGDRAVVQTGRCSTEGDYCVTIHLTKRHGNWRAEERTLQEEKIVIAGTPFAR